MLPALAPSEAVAKLRNCRLLFEVMVVLVFLKEGIPRRAGLDKVRKADGVSASWLASLQEDLSRLTTFA
jgi:hypothetical protein